MIKNAKQFGVSKQQIAKLQEALELSMKYPAEMDNRIYEAMIAGIESQIQDIQKEVDEYEKLQNTKEIPIDTFENVGQLLIKARIARGYTQKELAEKVGVKPQTIQQYEAKEYKSVSLARLGKIIKALDVNTSVEFAMPGNYLGEGNVPGVWNINKINTQPDDPIEVSYDSDWFGLQKVA